MTKFKFFCATREDKLKTPFGDVIPKDMNVFEPFVTENTVRSIGQGKGLGLAITKRVIDEHNARIYINEEVPEYTKAFVIEFK